MTSLICKIDAQLLKMLALLVWDKFGSKKSEHWPPNLCVRLLQHNVVFLQGMSHVYSPTLIDFFFRKTFSPLVETTLNSILPENVAVRDLGGQWGDLR